MPSSATALPELSRWLKERELMLQLVHQHLLRAQTRMKRQADKRHSERSFAVGDMVFVKLQPYVQSSVARRAHQKLAFRFFGPYRVLSRIGAVAYKLELPPSGSVHPVFHVSQLKASACDQVVSSSVPTYLVEFQVRAQILQTRWTAGAHPVQQVLVQWSQMLASLATWESLEELRRQFPRAPAWGHAGSKAGGDVRSPAPSPSATSEEASSEADDQEHLAQPAATRPKRNRRPNPAVLGPEWRV